MNMARVYKTKDSDAVPMQLLNVFVNYFSLIRLYQKRYFGRFGWCFL